MTDINRINPYININHKLNSKPAKHEETQEKQELNNQPRANHKSADDVLTFMANSNILPEKTDKAKSKSRVIPVSQYVTPEQAQRIAASVRSFEGNVANIANTAVNEFGISQEFAESIALETFANQYMPS